MIACMMGQLDSVKLLISEARKRLNKEQLKLFINIKVVKEMGGNNALLYACFTQNTNQQIVYYLICDAGADLNSMNDYNINLLLMATKKSQVFVLKLLLQYFDKL